LLQTEKCISKCTHPLRTASTCGHEAFQQLTYAQHRNVIQLHTFRFGVPKGRMWCIQAPHRDMQTCDQGFRSVANAYARSTNARPYQPLACISIFRVCRIGGRSDLTGRHSMTAACIPVQRSRGYHQDTASKAYVITHFCKTTGRVSTPHNITETRVGRARTEACTIEREGHVASDASNSLKVCDAGIRGVPRETIWRRYRTSLGNRGYVSTVDGFRALPCKSGSCLVAGQSTKVDS
jgi:hypothetical protein